MDPTPIREMPTEPSHGDLVLHCGHVLRARKHSYYAPDKIKYCRPDGSQHEASWLIICEECRQACGGDPSKVKVKGDGVWNKPPAKPKIILPNMAS